LIAAGTVAALLVASGIWYASWRRPQTPPKLAPNINLQPEVGGLIDSRQVLDGDFAATVFIEPVTDDIGLALGQSGGDLGQLTEDAWLTPSEGTADRDSYTITRPGQTQGDPPGTGGADGPDTGLGDEPDSDSQDSPDETSVTIVVGGDSGLTDDGNWTVTVTEDGVTQIVPDGPTDNDDVDVELAFPAESKAALAAFDLVTGQRRWQVDLIAAAGLAPGSSVYWASAWPDDQGNTVVHLPNGPAGGGVLVSLDGLTGELVSRGRISGTPVACANGIQVVTDLDGDGLVTAYRTDALSDSLWSAKGKSWPVLISQTAGVFWVPTEDGYAEAASGQLVGFGKAADSDHASYFLAAASDQPVVLADHGDGRIDRIEPSTGSPVWQARLPGVPSGHKRFTATAAVLEYQSRGQLGLAAFDLATGQERWVLAGASLPPDHDSSAQVWVPQSAVVGDAVWVWSSGNLTVLDTADGRPLFNVQDGSACLAAAQSSVTGYLACGPDIALTQLRAVSLDTLGPAIWQVEIALPVGWEAAQLGYSDKLMWVTKTYVDASQPTGGYMLWRSIRTRSATS
jgi:hypothetical protein